MKHDRRRICLSNNILYEWDKYTIQWALREEEGPLVFWFLPGSEYGRAACSESYVLDPQTGILSFPGPPMFHSSGFPVDDDYYWIPVLRGTTVGREDWENLDVMYKGKIEGSSYLWLPLTGFNGNIISTGDAIPPNKVKFKYTKQQVKSEYVETVSDYNIGAYPDNGVQDGYWYVRRAK